MGVGPRGEPEVRHAGAEAATTNEGAEPLSASRKRVARDGSPAASAARAARASASRWSGSTASAAVHSSRAPGAIAAVEQEPGQVEAEGDIGGLKLDRRL